MVINDNQKQVSKTKSQKIETEGTSPLGKNKMKNRESFTDLTKIKEALPPIEENSPIEKPQNSKFHREQIIQMLKDQPNPFNKI